MRVALSGWFWNRPETGSGQYLRRLLAALTAHDSETEYHLIAPPDHLVDRAALARVRAHPLPAPGGAAGKLWWEQVLLPRCVRQLRPDLLHIPYWAPPLRCAVPTVVTVHDLIPRLLPAYRGSPLVRAYTALVSAATPRAAAVLTDSEAARRDIIAHLRVPPERVWAVLLAADAGYTPTPAPEDGAVRAAWGLAPGYVLYLGGFDVRKNLRAVCAAFAQARLGAENDVPLVIAGRLPAADTAFTPDPRRLAREAGLPEGWVRFLGFVPEAEKPALYRGARAFLFPSRYEGFGLPPLEALACGVPVVGSDAASLPEVVGAGGVLTAPDDVAGMAAALRRLLTDDAFHTDLRERGLVQAARFSWARTAAETREVYVTVQKQ